MTIKGFIYDTPEFISEMEDGDIFVITKTPNSDTGYANIYKCIQSKKEKKFIQYKIYSVKNLYSAKKEDFYEAEYTEDQLKEIYISFHNVDE